jgi:hypothetical protein
MITVCFPYCAGVAVETRGVPPKPRCFLHFSLKEGAGMVDIPAPSISEETNY